MTLTQTHSTTLLSLLQRACLVRIVPLIDEFSLKISHGDKVPLKIQGLCPTTGYFYNASCAYAPAQFMSISWFLYSGNALGMRATLETYSAERSLICPSHTFRDPEANLAFRDLPASLRFASTTAGKLPCGAVGCKMPQAMLGRHTALLGTSANREGFLCSCYC